MNTTSIIYILESFLPEFTISDAYRELGGLTIESKGESLFLLSPTDKTGRSGQGTWFLVTADSRESVAQEIASTIEEALEIKVKVETTGTSLTTWRS